MKKLLKYRLDKIETPGRFVEEDFPTELFLEEAFSEEVILSLAKTLVAKLQVNAMNSEPLDINKYVFNEHSASDFTNQSFFNLVASVLDYIKQSDDLIKLNDPNQRFKIFQKAIDATLNAVIALTIKRNPIIIKLLNENQKTDVKHITNQTILNVKKMDRKKSCADLNDKGNKMSDMMKYLLLSKMMKSRNEVKVETSNASSSSSINPMMLMAMSQRGGNNDDMMQKMMAMQRMGGNSSNMSKYLVLSQLMNKKNDSPMVDERTERMNQMMSMMRGGGFGANFNQMSMMNDPAAMKQKMIQNMLMKQMAKKQMEKQAKTSTDNWMAMFNQMNQNPEDEAVNRLANSRPDPQLADVYASMNADIPNDNPSFKQLQEDILKAEINNKRLEALQSGVLIPNDASIEEDEDESDDETTFMNWLNDVEEDDIHEEEKLEQQKTISTPFYDSFQEGSISDDFHEDAGDLDMVKYESDYIVNDNPHFMEMFSTDTDEDVAIQEKQIEVTPESTEEEKWIKYMNDDQEKVIQKWFNGVVPEGIDRIEVDGANYYAFTPEALYSGSYTAAETLKYYFAKGERPPASAASLPLTLKGINRVVSILTSDGVRGDIILPDIQGTENMDIDDHIPPKAIVEWRKLREKEIFDENGKAITDGIVVMENELVGTTNNASIVANCFAISTEEIDIANSTNRPIEYYVNDPKGFYVEEVGSILKVFGVDKDYDSISDLVKTINDSEITHAGILSYIVNKGTDAMNDYIQYSMGLDVTISNFLTDYDELVEFVEDQSDVPYADYLNNYQKELVGIVCNAVRGDTISNLETISGEMEKEKVKDGKVKTEVVSFEGSDLDNNLVIFNDKVQVTEMPWTFADTRLTLVKQLEHAAPFIVLQNNEDNRDIYTAINEIYDRGLFDGETRKIKLITKDLVELEIMKSAYEDDVLVLINR